MKLRTGLTTIQFFNFQWEVIYIQRKENNKKIIRSEYTDLVALHHTKHVQFADILIMFLLTCRWSLIEYTMMSENIHYA